MSDHKEVTALLSKKRLIALGTVSTMALCMAAAPAVAQETEEENDEPTEQIVVRGYVSALESAQDFKEEADTFLDAITAEDIGALPDRSVAEALQRVPGVNVGRFQKTTDPDRFSVEGAGVIIRGLPFVRSELNGRDVFSATGGRELSFNDVSPELLGRVEVFKNTTADMIDGGISGTVNLVTRNPLDSPGLRFGGTVEGNYGDLAEEWSPAFSLLGSNTWDTRIGSFGFQVGYAQSELVSRTDASQVTDPCYRADTLDGPCFRVNSVSDSGVGGQNFDASNFPPANSVLVPKGAGVRTTTFNRERDALSLVGQWESNDGQFLVTVEYLRAQADLTLDEYAILALVNDDALFPVEAFGTNWNFDSAGRFQSGILSQNAWRGADNCLPGSLESPPGLGIPCSSQVGIPTEMLRFDQQNSSTTEDFSVDVDWSPSDSLRFNFEYQSIKADRQSDSVITAMQTYSDIFIDVTGETPIVNFLPPTTTDGSHTGPLGQDYFTNPDRTNYWFIIDNQIRNEGEMDSFRVDGELDLNPEGFFQSVRFGARWADRNRVTRDANFSNWGNLSAPWLGNSQWASQHPNFSQVRNPFEGFQRGEVPLPVPGGAGIFFGGDNLVQEYLSGLTDQQATEVIIAWEDTFGFWNRPEFGPFDTSWAPIGNRFGTVGGTPFLEGEISDVSEQTQAFYARTDFAKDDFLVPGWTLEGNIGVRYVETTIGSDGQISFPSGPAPDLTVFCDPALLPVGASLPGYCSLSPERQAEWLTAFTGSTIDDDADIEFSNWLPSFNATLEVREGLLFRLGISEGISRPDLAAFRTGGALFDNTNDLRAGGTLETGPLFQIFTGNRLLRPVESTNIDFSIEWYFAEVGQLTVSFFQKDLDGLISLGVTERDFTDGGVTIAAEVNGPANVDSGTLRGFEVAHQQVYDFLPGHFANLGTQFTYTYVDASELTSPDNFVARSAFAAGLPLNGVSENTINAVVFYEDDKYSARLAYNWRSEFLLTPRDDIFPFNPIYGEDTGQLDGSFFYNVTDNFTIGAQGVNLLDEVTSTTQIVDFGGTRMPRSAFRNDRRFTIVGRFSY
jgi:TonB-dependent receptor